MGQIFEGGLSGGTELKLDAQVAEERPSKQITVKVAQNPIEYTCVRVAVR